MACWWIASVLRRNVAACRSFGHEAALHYIVAERAFAISAAMPDLLGACRASVADLRIAYSNTLGYARPDTDVAASVAGAAHTFEELGCAVEKVDKVFERDPADLWTAEFYAGVGTRLRPFVQTQRDLLDPAVAEVLDAALSQDMRDYYEKVFERYAFRDKVRAFFETYDLLLSPVLPITSLDAPARTFRIISRTVIWCPGCIILTRST